ncbi:MAG: hypothetical protein ABSG64_01610 [Solirubrobacteraceae bacterium]|jgi:hypothetical protein
MEITLLNISPARRRLAASLGVLATAVAVPVIGPALVRADGIHSGATAKTASADPNDYTCNGYIKAGTAEPGTPGKQVVYDFACNGPITGYQIDTEPHQILYYDASPVASLYSQPTQDNFECSGFVPGVAINCTGASSVANEAISGQFSIGGNLCTEPRLDPILTVTDATATGTYSSTTKLVTTTVTQYMSGPFDLGRPQGCKGDLFGSDTRLGDNPPYIVLTHATKNGELLTTPLPTAPKTKAKGSK